MNRTLNGLEFIRLIESAGNNLRNRVQEVNALNVFPVPDGDTGTNMDLTFSTGLKEMKNRPSEHIGQVSEQLSRGLLMGARGNSGVILSQLFRGFAKFASGHATLDAKQFAAALQQGVDTAYKAVVKPVEGTILTVAKEAAKQGLVTSESTDDIVQTMEDVYRMSVKALSKTPDQLPVLKQAGVVDSGGQGLVYIYEGILSSLKGEDVGQSSVISVESHHAEQVEVTNHGHMAAQAHWKTEDIEFGYCTEFLIQRENPQGDGFDEAAFREQLEQFGDSLVVVSDDDLVKVHIHAEMPGEVMNFAMKYGGLTRIKIENMREQHSHIVDMDMPGHHSLPDQPVQLKANGLVVVAAGDGIEDVFQSLGADLILSGGQTMNPSTEQILQAIDQVQAEHVYILPNNSNIILTAQQAAELSDRNVIVIPSKTIPQGMAAALSYQSDGEASANETAMNRAMEQVVSGSITYAVRDSEMDGITINKGDYLGICNNRIVTAHADLITSCRELLSLMIHEDSEVISVFYGEDAETDHNEALMELIQSNYPDLELDFHHGGQPVYRYLFSVE